MWTVSPPELHLLIGVVDKLLSGIENNVFSTKEEGVKFMDKFLKRVIYDVLCITLHIIGYLCSDVYCTQIIHGGSQFRGMWYNLYSYKSRLFI